MRERERGGEVGKKGNTGNEEWMYRGREYGAD